jgi:photosystem II P680 reaction center D2 protein
MTISIGQKQERGIFDLADDWLKRDRFVLLGVWTTTFPMCFLITWWVVNRYHFRNFMVHSRFQYLRLISQFRRNHGRIGCSV